jgi:hypothetical protein
MFSSQHERVAPVAGHCLSFVRSSGLLPFDRICNLGMWKFIVIRMTEFHELMLVVCTFSPLPSNTVASLVGAFGDTVTLLFRFQIRFPRVNTAPFIFLF